MTPRPPGARMPAALKAAAAIAAGVLCLAVLQKLMGKPAPMAHAATWARWLATTGLSAGSLGAALFLPTRTAARVALAMVGWFLAGFVLVIANPAGLLVAGIFVLPVTLVLCVLAGRLWPHARWDAPAWNMADTAPASTARNGCFFALVVFFGTALAILVWFRYFQ